MTTKPKAQTKAEPKTRKRKVAADDPEQYKRFREFAREVEADDDSAAFDRAFRKIVPRSRAD
jgi:hypothetical protein